MTGDKPSHNGEKRNGGSGSAGRLEIGVPVVEDGPALHRITVDSGALDVNSSYTYLLWCRDFARTSVVARVDDAVVGFVTGYLRPEAPETIMVWQVAVDASQRGGGVASTLLDGLLDRVVPLGVRYLETTITPDNAASIKLFSALARNWSAELRTTELFTSDLFPGEHASEDLYRIGPFSERFAGTPARVPGGV